MKQLFTVLVALIVFFNAHTQAQDSSFDDLYLNGMASYEQLRKEYYIGALYLETISQSADSVITMPGKKRMEIRITIDKWSRRRFTQQWNQAILINNDQKALETFSQQILDFTNIPRQDLLANDRIVIDMNPESGTTVYLNQQKMFHTSEVAFFDLLLNTWIGQRPPSTDFKQSILTLSTDQAGTDLLTRYESIKPDQSRKSAIADWLKSEEAAAAKPKTPSRVAKTNAPSAIAPPGSSTRVTAKRTRTTSKAPAASTRPAPVTSLPEPTIALEKPTLNQSKATTKKPVSKPVPTKAQPSTPKPEPVAAAKPVITQPAKKQLSEEAKKQQGLFKNYRSNVLKVTYLNTQYPKRAMDLEQEGLVVLKVVLNRRGKLLDITTESPSKHNLLNKAAQNAVRKSAPFPKPPKGLEGDTIEMTLPFNFKL